jgi:hypothetical protein
MRHRQSSKQPDLWPPKEPRSSGLRGGAYDKPHVNKGRSDITQVEAYSPGHKGKTQKLRPRWGY